MGLAFGGAREERNVAIANLYMLTKESQTELTLLSVGDLFCQSRSLGRKATKRGFCLRNSNSIIVRFYGQ